MAMIDPAISVTEAPDPYFYQCTRVPKPLGNALAYAVDGNTKMVSGGDLPEPPATDADFAMLCAWWADLFAALDAVGVIDAYRRNVIFEAVPAACPWWCHGEHSPIAGGFDPIWHEMPLYFVTFGEGEGDLAGVTWRVCIGCYQDETATSRPNIAVLGKDTDGQPREPELAQLSVVAARDLANLLQDAADMLETIECL